MPTHEGSQPCYARGCREPECREAHRIYNRDMARERRRPDSTWDNPLLDAAPVRAHLLELQAKGMGQVRIAKKARLMSRDIWELRSGRRKKCFKKTATAVLAVEYEPLPLVDVTEAREHLRFLQCHGIGVIRISKACGVNPRTLTGIRSGKSHGTSPDKASKILGLGLHMFADSYLARPKQAIAALPENFVSLEEAS